MFKIWVIVGFMGTFRGAFKINIRINILVNKGPENVS